MFKEKYGIEHFENEELELEKTPEELYDNNTIKVLIQSKSFFKWISLIIIFYLISSYIGTKYLPALCLNYFYYFIPSGRFLNPIPKKASLFHDKTSFTEGDNNKFFQYDKDLEKFYYELPNYRPSFLKVLKGLFTSSYGSINVSKPEMEKIYVLESNSLNPFQKIITIIIAGFQLFFSIIFTWFNACTNIFYLFFPNPNTSFFFNTAYVYEKLDSDEKNKYFKSVDTEIPDNKTNKIISYGWINFKNFINYIGLFFTDQLTYGASYMSSDDIEKFEFYKTDNKFKTVNPFKVWWNRIKNFFTLFLPFLILFNWFKKDMTSLISGSSIIVTCIIITFYAALRILNENKNPYPCFNYNDLKEKFEVDTLNKVFDKIKTTTEDVYKMNKKYTDDSIKTASNIGMSLTSHEKYEKK